MSNVEEFVTEKAELLLDVIVDNPRFDLSDIDNAKLFIRLLIKETVKKTGITEKVIEKKAMELAEIFRNPKRAVLHTAIINTEYFIRSLVEELEGWRSNLEERLSKLERPGK